MNKNFKNIVSKTKTTKPNDGKREKKTSWGNVADWYDSHLSTTDDNYHLKVIFPNLSRIFGDIKGKNFVDLACGQGIFTEILSKDAANVVGIDISKELIAIAKKNQSINKNGNKKIKNIAEYFVSPSDDLFMIKNVSADFVVCILAIQNIEKLEETIKEVSRVLKDSGSFIFVINHPTFRNPRKSSWGYDEEENIQYRRIDEYMSESNIKIDMTPGSKTDKKFTVSFHRPLQLYIKTLSKNGFVITRLEEWISHKESKKGPKQIAENKSRKEIPLFMCIEAKKII